MTVGGFSLYRRKTTDYKVCYRDNLDRIGNVYLPRPMAERLGLGEEITIQLARDKSNFLPGGYVTAISPCKETPKKIRFKENTREQGALGVIYVSKKILEDMGLDSGEIAVRIIAGGKQEIHMPEAIRRRPGAIKHNFQ